MQVYAVEHADDKVESPEVSGGMDVEDTDILDARGTAETISSPANELDLTFHFDAPNAKRNALELQELLNQPDTAPLPISFASEPTVDGYYTISSTRRSIQFLTDGDGTHETITASATKVGTRSSHKRAIRTSQSTPDPGNVFGSASTAYVAVPSHATRVRWYNREFTKETAATVSGVSPVETRFGTLDVYDANDAPSTYGDTPVLVYDVDSYPDGGGDVIVWDTYGNSESSDWNRVFDPAHDPRGDDELIVENGLIRLWLQDEPEQNIRADEWDPSTSSWSSVSLPTASDYTLVETDLLRIGPVAVEAQCVFKAGSSTNTLTMRLERGRQYPQWLVPQSVTDNPPSNLKDLLDPIADDSEIVTEASLGLVSRRKLRL